MAISKLLNIRRQINKPEYFFRPQQLIKRLLYRNQNRKKVATQVDLSEHPFYVNESEVIGKSILTMGVYDLIVAECLERILKPGDCFFDVGANIGYFSRVAAARGAHVSAFEPHPQIFDRLKTNLQAFPQATLHNLALSNEEGSFKLYIPEDFQENEGVASLEYQENSKSIDVATKTLSQIHNLPIRLMKIDVEGHEGAVLKGASSLLEQKKIDFIILEEFNPESSLAFLELKKYGYSILRLKKNLWGPEVVDMNESHKIPLWEPPNFIASHTKEKIEVLFKEKAWQFLKH